MKRVKTALLFNDKYKQGYSYIMANPTTTEEWKQVAANAQAEITSVQQQKVQGEAQITALEQQLLANGQQISDYLIANPRITSRDPGLLALQAQTDTIKQNLAKTEVYVRATLTSQLFQLRATINNANRQAGVASSGAPDTSTNTPPETTVPNQSNTTVTTTTLPEPSAQLNPNIDPNTNIGADAQDVVFEPLQEPPATTDGDEFTGIDEQVERQRQLEDGSLEFAGIDEQIAANETGLQEPPQLSDEEIEQQLGLAAAQEETIAEQKVPDEFDGIDEQVAANKEQADAEAADAAADAGNSRGLSTILRDTQGQATQQDVANFQAKPDWRVRLSLAPGATYLYKDKAPGILAPLTATDGVIFPYTPAISVQYAASYDATELTHSNYKFFSYRGSAVDSVSITCDFTAQDTFEANYLLAVIHFFRSVTKMFYGQDQNPKIGTPPPLCYLSGLGAFQFDAHPLAITSFNYSLPTDVDYIRAGSTPTPAGVSKAPANTPVNSSSVSGSRLAASKGSPGGGTAPPQFTTPAGSRDVTYVPTKMSISIQAVPIVTRNDISNKFSLKEYATGKLLRGTQRQGGGIW